MTGNILKYNYKNTLKLKYWEKYLGRNLLEEEFALIKEVEIESSMNRKIMDIYNLAKTNNLYIPQLTTLVGNCIFESLQYHELCDDIKEFRCGLAYLLILFKDTKNFIPGTDMTLEEMFKNTNEIEHIYCKKNKKLYEYTFVTMCLDLATNNSYTRLNTELLFVALSYLLNLKIKILHNNGHITEIKTIENDQTITIHLGLINEIHYIPVASRINHPIEDVCPKYLNNTRTFHHWAREMAIMTGKVEYDIDIEFKAKKVQQSLTEKQNPHNLQKPTPSFTKFRNMPDQCNNNSMGTFSKIPMTSDDTDLVNF